MNFFLLFFYCRPRQSRSFFTSNLLKSATKRSWNLLIQHAKNQSQHTSETPPHKQDNTSPVKSVYILSFITAFLHATCGEHYCLTSDLPTHFGWVREETRYLQLSPRDPSWCSLQALLLTKILWLPGHGHSSLSFPLSPSLPPSLSEAVLLPLEELKVVGAMLNLTSSLVFFLCAS